MAKVDFPPDPTGAFLNSATYINPNPNIRPRTEGKRTPGGGRTSRPTKPDFSSVMEQSQNAELGPPEALPVSEETVNRLLEDVRSTGDELRGRPFPQEILAYKKAVRDFIRYVVDNGYQLGESEGVRRFEKPSYKGKRGTPRSQERQPYVTIQVVDHKLEEMAAMLMTHQLSQLELLSRLEEISGLLIDLVS
ncbi:MAG: YaaR family protein [Treponema sp.]|nr:YaaR family protein [Treponema sp.]